MATTPPTSATPLRLRPRPEWGAFLPLAKSLDRTNLTASHVLTYPQIDLAGDLVEPDGGRWADRPYVNYEHDAGADIGTGSVSLKSFPDGDARVTLPVGKTTFHDSDLGHQAFRLVEAGVLGGASLEFTPGDKTVLGKSLLERRPAYHFRTWDGLGWALCRNPINTDARLLPDSLGKAVSWLRDGRIDGKPLDGVIRKALQPLAPLAAKKPPTATVPRSVKAMDYSDPPMDAPVADTPTDTPPADEPPADADADTAPEIADAYDAAQAASDVAEKLRERAAKTLDDKTRKVFERMADDFDSSAEDLVAHAEMLEAKLSGREPAGEADEGDGAGEAAGDEPADEPTEKALRPVPRPLKKAADGRIQTKSGFRTRRNFLLADARPAAKARPAGDDDAVDAVEAILAEAHAHRREAARARRHARGHGRTH